MDENNINMSSYCGEDAHNVWFFLVCIEFWKHWMNNLPSEYKCVMVRIITLLISYQYYNYKGKKKWIVQENLTYF
jgi:hypothetical protein